MNYRIITIVWFFITSCAYAQDEWEKLPDGFNDQNFFIKYDYLVASKQDKTQNQTVIWQLKIGSTEWKAVKVDGIANVNSDIIWLEKQKILKFALPKWPLVSAPIFKEGDSIATIRSVKLWKDSLIINNFRAFIVADTNGVFHNVYQYLKNSVANQKDINKTRLNNAGKVALKIATLGKFGGKKKRVPKAIYYGAPVVKNVFVSNRNNVILTGIYNNFDVLTGMPASYSGYFTYNNKYDAFSKVEFYFDKQFIYAISFVTSKESIITKYQEEVYQQRAMLVQKIDPMKGLIWEQKIAFKKDENPEYFFHFNHFHLQGVYIDAKQNLFLFGEHLNSHEKKLKFTDINGKKYKWPNSSAFVLKMNNEGKVLWAKNYGQQVLKHYVTALALSEDADGLKLLLAKRNSSKKSYVNVAPPYGSYFNLSSYRYFENYKWLNLDHEGNVQEKDVIVKELETIEESEVFNKRF